MSGATAAGGARVTERLRLTPIGPEHAAELLELFTDPGVARWYGDWTAERAAAAAADMGRAWRTDGVHKWLAHDRRNGELVGRGGLSYAQVAGARRLEVGWVVRERFWGRGYATEIGRAGLEMAFGELAAEEVVAFTEPHNRRSRAVMERLGFRFHGGITHDGAPFVLYTVGPTRAWVV